MFKSATLLVIGLACVSAQFLSFEDRLLQAVNATSITTTCARGSTETCTQSGYCCAGITKNGTAPASTATGLCIPAEFNGLSFVNVSSSNYTVTCAVAATATNATSTLNSTNCSTCSNSTSQCCGSRSYNLGGITVTSTVSSCITNTQGAQTVAWASYFANSTFGAINAQVIGTCPVPATTTGTSSGNSTTSSFGAYIKVSAMLFVALVSAVFF